MCDLMDSMEEGSPLKPKATHIHHLSPPLSFSSLYPSPSFIQQHTRQASKRSNAEFYREALDFLSNVGPSQVLQREEEPKEKTCTEASAEEADCEVDLAAGVKSYKHCLKWKSACAGRIDLSEFPPRLRPSALKDELNTEFQEKYPFLPRKLTLSKILSLKDALVRVLCLQMHHDPMLAAVAWIYFERLLGQGLVNKQNRKVYCAACALLSIKFYAEASPRKSEDLTTSRLDSTGHLSQKTLLEREFEVYAALRFSLLLPLSEVQPTYEKILKRLELLVSF